MTGTMQYIKTQQPLQSGGPRKYHGEVASGYDAKRKDSPKWKIEQSIIEDMLIDLPSGSWVLDAPCGTGRFFDYYEKRGFVVRAIDISADMLKQAANKVVSPNATVGGHQQWAFAQTSVHKTGMPDASIDAVCMIRLTRWLEPAECQIAFKELQRVSRDRIILTARIANHPHARPVELFTDVLEPGWRLDQNVSGYDEDYRILLFRRQIK